MSELHPLPIAITITSLIFLALYGCYRVALPRPLPGIPYNKKAASRVFGDAPELVGYIRKHGESFSWLAALAKKHQSPIVQAFVRPLSLPWVIVADPLESQDIVLRRTKELDRARFIIEVTGDLLPDFHGGLPSTDPRYKSNRSMINQLMAPTFIDQISGPNVYRSVSTLMELWRIKCTLAAGHPFEAHRDVRYAALDGMIASSSSLPDEQSITAQQLVAIHNYSSDLPQETNAPLEFPAPRIPEIAQALMVLADFQMYSLLSPVPRLTSRIMLKFPHFRRAVAEKDAYIKSEIDKAVRKIDKGDCKPKDAFHSVTLRERELATKQGRPPAYHKRAIYDEFYGFIQAGHETSATTISWGLKYLADNQAAQERLRRDLQEVMPQAVREKRQPTFEEIANARIPYLDAVVHEVLRLAHVIDFLIREATQDTVVMGHRIPKGTNIFLLSGGPGFVEPRLPFVDDAARSPGARRGSGKQLAGDWDDETIRQFRPERWIATNPGGGTGEEEKEEEEVHDPLAGPLLAFGMGPRVCFGKRLALATLRTTFALVVWNFRLLECPRELSSYRGVQRFAREPVQCFVRLEPVVFGEEL